mgnify:CR=1 FL=1
MHIWFKCTYEYQQSSMNWYTEPFTNWWCTNNAPYITGGYLLDLGGNDYHGADNNGEWAKHCKCQIRKWFGM